MNFKIERICFALGPSCLLAPKRLSILLFFVFVLFFFLFFFAAKTTLQWYFIVGPLLAVTVLSFMVLCLWKRRIAGTYTMHFARLENPYQHNKIRSTELKMNRECSMKKKRIKKICEY